MQLLVRLGLVPLADRLHGAQRRPPHAHGVALGGGLQGQEDVGESHGRGREVRVGHHAELHVLQHLVDARRGVARAGDGVGALRPEHLHGIGLARLEGLVHRVAVGHADEVHVAGMHHVHRELLGERLRRAVQLGRGVAGIDVEAVAHQQVRARLVDVAAHAHDVAHRLAQLDGVVLRVEGQAPLDGAALGLGVEACGLADEVGIEPGHLGRPFGRELRHVVLQVVVVGAPLVHEVGVVQIFLRDDVEPGKRHGHVGGRTQRQPVHRMGSDPRELRVDAHELGALLHAGHQPVAQVPVGVGLQRLAAPHHHDVRAHPFAVDVAVLMPFRGVHDGEVADARGRAARARQVARIARRPDGADVRRAQAGAAQKRHPGRDVAAGAVVHEDGLAAEAGFVDVGVDPVGDGVERLVPRDALPLVLAALACALERVLGAVFVVHALFQVQAAHAQTAVGARIQRVALYLFQLAVLRVHEHAARRVAAGRGIGVGARDGVAVLFPLPLPFVVGLPVDAVEELLIIEQHWLFPLLL